MKRTLLVLALAVGLAASAKAPNKKLTREVPADGYRAQYGYVLCKADHIVHPTSTAEVAEAVTKYSAQAEAEGKALKIRMSRNLFHSTAIFPCPNQDIAMMRDGVDAPAPGILALGVLSDKLNGVLAVDAAAHTMTVGAGMDMNKLFKEATANSMSVQLMTLPFYAGLTLGGILATSSHGTGDRVPSAFVDMVLEATWVDATGKVHVASRDTPETWGAINGGLGLIGLVTEIKLQLTPPTNTQLTTLLNQDDANIFADINRLLKITPHILIFWRPDMRRYSAFMTSIAPPDAPADPDVSMALLPDLSRHSPMAVPFKAWQSDIYDQDPMRTLMCYYPPPVSVVQQLTVHRAWARAGGRFGEERFNVTAPTNQMQAAECDQNCLWNGPAFKGTAQDAEFAIEWDSFKPWIADIKAIFEKDLFRNGTRRERCQGAGYMWLRFGHGTSDDYLSMTSGLKRPVYLQSTWLRNTDVWQYPVRYGYVPELIELMTLCKYNARPHFGKNWGRTYTHKACPVRPRYPRFDELLAVQAKVDPKKVFEPSLFAKIAAGESYKHYPSCATDYECFCEEDGHCAPEFRCLPSFALPQFKVCKPPADWDARLIANGQSTTMKAMLAGTRGTAGAIHRVFGDVLNRFYTMGGDDRRRRRA